MHWNNRLVVYPNGDVSLCEVYYTNEGQIGFSPATVADFESVDELRRHYLRMAEAFKHDPILRSDFEHAPIDADEIED